MVRHNIDDPFAPIVSGDRNQGNGKLIRKRSIDSNDALDGASQHQMRQSLQKFRVMAMTYYEVEKPILQKLILDSAEHRG
jgi:hypothetical protein